VLAIVGVVVAAVLGYATLEALPPSFTDAAITVSIVDTWQVEAVISVLLLCVLVVAVCVAVILARAALPPLLRRVAGVVVVLGIVGGGAIVANHIALTNRAASLTGQSFGGFYGLP
jgi:hypothetical protein